MIQMDIQKKVETRHTKTRRETLTHTGRIRLEYICRNAYEREWEREYEMGGKRDKMKGP